MTLNQFRIYAHRPCCYCNPVFIGLVDVCAHRLNVVAMLINHQLYKGLANAKGPCDCSMLRLRPKSSLCSCRHRILNRTSFGFGNADSVHRASNNGVGQFKPVFQVEGNTFRAILFGYFIVNWPATTLPLEVLTQRNFVADFILLKLSFILKNWKVGFWATLWNTLG